MLGTKNDLSNSIDFIYFFFFRFRKGKLYRYNLKNYNIDSFSAFATDWYRNVRSESIPIPKSPL